MYTRSITQKGIESMEKYDCTNDVNDHKERVAFWIRWIIEVLEYRAEHHDDSKLQEPEKSVFDEYVPKLKEFEFGSDEYKAALKEMEAGLKHHYKHNPHHPESFVKGIAGMQIWDVVEMIADWMAAASVKDKNIDLDYLEGRFGISLQLRHIIENTLWCADMDAINYRIPKEFEQKANFYKKPPGSLTATRTERNR